MKARIRVILTGMLGGFPTAEAWRAVIVEGRPEYGRAAVGKGHDSAGSELLTRAARKEETP